jgi:hydrogenase/urease accessory protein HupE
MKNKVYAILAVLFVLVIMSSLVLAAEEPGNENASQAFRIGIDELITLGSSILAITLFAITAIAYKRDRRKKLLYVTIAFLLFAVKGFLIASDIFFPNKTGWVDPIANFLDFGILLSFFFGIIKK